MGLWARVLAPPVLVGGALPVVVALDPVGRLPEVVGERVALVTVPLELTETETEAEEEAVPEEERVTEPDEEGEAEEELVEETAEGAAVAPWIWNGPT